MLGSLAGRRELTVQTGLLVSAVRQKPIIWSRVGSVSCSNSTMRRGWLNRRQAVLTRRAASAASPGGNSPDAMPLAIICSKIAAMRSLCRRMIAQFSAIAASIKSCNLRSNIYCLWWVFSTDPIKLRIL